MPLFKIPIIEDFPNRAFREALRNWKNLEEAVTEALPELAALLDFEKANYVECEFLLEDWRGRESDLLVLIPLRETSEEKDETKTEAETKGEDKPKKRPPVLICILLEHQTNPDRLMPLRVLLYAVLFWEQQWKEYASRHKDGSSLYLTPVVPIVFHTGTGTWNTSRNLGELFAGPVGFRQWAPSWPICFWDLNSRTAQELLAADGPFRKLLAAVRMDGSGPEEFRGVFVEAVERLAPLAHEDKMRWVDLLWILIGWVQQRRPADEREALLAAAAASQPDKTLGQELSSMSTVAQETWSEFHLRRLKEEVRKEFDKEFTQKLADATQKVTADFTQKLEAATQKLEDAQKAAAEATRNSLRQMLVTLLTVKLKAPPPEATLAQIQACEDVARLEAAIRSVVGLESLAEFRL